MSLIWRRYARSKGYAPAWFYGLMAVGFAALVIWAMVAQDWVVAAIAGAMIVAATVGIPVTRRLARGLASWEEQQRR